ncbi:MAG: hydratase [Oscillospiraceae bacterium]|jgi:aconitate hydratase|nr:hydratase [Oscillospiraceae bacterium]
MIKLTSSGVSLKNGAPTAVPASNADASAGFLATMAGGIIGNHNASGSFDELRLKYDALISHDITYVGIIQTALASGLQSFPVQYALTNCHNSLCAVGGTINEDDHIFGLSAARRFGGDYVPANLAVIHQYAREMLAGCGKMLLGSDSHTRYGALGTLGVGEGGPELVKQLLGNTYDVKRPDVVLVYVTGAPGHGVGPQDVAIALCGATYENGFVKNKILEFVGPGIKNLPMDFRIGIDVMTTETACLSSIWETDSLVEEYYAIHGRPENYKTLSPREGAYYSALIELQLDKIEPMAALPFHPSKAISLRELQANAGDVLRQIELDAEKSLPGGAGLHLTDKLQNGKLVVDQGIIAGCSGGMYDNIAEAAAIMGAGSTGNGYFSLAVYPPSVPVNLELIKNGVQKSLMESGALFKSCFCGPCFGAGDVPGNSALSIRHATRNFPNREGSKPTDGQISAVMLMDARSIAATAANGGLLTSASDVDYAPPAKVAREFDRGIYDKRVYFGFGKPQKDEPLRMGPNIAPWPYIPELPENLLLRIDSVLTDDVTTTDELIPSGETSSYRSNPLKLASFTLSRRDPGYVSRARETASLESLRANSDLPEMLEKVAQKLEISPAQLQNSRLGSVVVARKPGDGSAREQAASCQRVLGGAANVCYEFATKRYRSNCINWGMLPLTLESGESFDFEVGGYLWLPDVRAAVENRVERLDARLIGKAETRALTLNLSGLTDEERQILLDGCLINYYSRRRTTN